MTTTSKKQLAGNLFTTMTQAGHSRKDIIAQMVAVAGLTYTGASTYYQNFKSGSWSASGSTGTTTTRRYNNQPVTQQPVETSFKEDRLAAMTDYQLLELHNKHALIRLVGFQSREQLLAEVRKFVHVIK